MLLTDLEVSGFRNLELTKTTRFQSGLNLIIGENGAGKTSLLESIYYLSHGKSFRTNKHALLLCNSASDFIIRASFATDSAAEGDHTSQFGVTYNLDAGRKISRDRQQQKSFASIAAEIPVLYIGADSHFAWQTSSKQRRSHLDWGVFHVEHSFLQAWRDFNSLLAQYNRGLKDNLPEAHLLRWREQLALSGEAITKMRSSYVDLLKPKFAAFAAEIGNMHNMSLLYKSGWDEHLSLFDSLELSKAKDRIVGYCHVGPQRSDLNFVQEERIVKDELSQGQMKLTLYALKLAQAGILQQVTNKQVLYLIDDMPSELDLSKQQKIIDLCSMANNQILLTAISKMIHVKHQASKFNLEAGSLMPC